MNLNPRNLPMRRFRQVEALCARCKMRFAKMATFGGWSTHLCVDRLRSRAFDAFLDSLAEAVPERRPPSLDTFVGLTSLYLRVPPWERPVIDAILRHAGIATA